MKGFRLLRTYLLTILFTIPVVTGAAAYFMARGFQQELFDEAKDFATAVAENVFHHLEEEFLRPAIAEGRSIDLLQDQAQRIRVREIVERSTHAYRVAKLYLFDRDGQINYSTVEEHIGATIPAGNEQFRRALSGQVASVVRNRDNPLDISVTRPGEELLETYVPVYAALGGRGSELVGVVEVYQEMADLRAAVQRARWRTALAALASMGILGGIFALITLKADRTIQSREEDILAKNRALLELSEDLERQVEERTQQLIGREKLASLGTLAAGVAHEINNPLATIAACSEGSLGRLGDGQLRAEERSALRSYLELINSEVYRCKRITENLLDFSRQHPAEPLEPLDLNEFVRQTVELVRLGEESRGVTIDLELKARSDGLRGDPTQIRQVIHNLLANSLAAVKEVAEPRILLGTRSNDHQAVLECLDNGPGVAPEIRDKVFEPFFTTKPAGEGTGLGLSVCYSIAQRHGGSLAVVPPEGRSPLPRWRGRVGAWIRLTLPVAGPGGVAP